jgi:hypothetical protein
MCDFKEYLPEQLFTGLEKKAIIETEDGYILQGNIVLIERAESWRDSEKVPMCEIDNHFLIAEKECWKVMYMPQTKFDKPFVTNKWVYKFHSEGVLHIKDEIDEEE